MRIGVFGGTFDPVHLGHLIVAEQCREQARLDRVLFIPAWKPPHKLEQELAPFHHRVEMLQLALAGHPAFQIDELERNRPGPSYTVDTLEELQRRHPHDGLFLMIGADCLPDLPHWREPARIVVLAGLLVAARSGWSLWSEEQIRTALNLPPEVPLRVQVVQVPLIDDASRDLRRRVRQGHSIRYLVPRAVECYIQTHHLYQPSKNSPAA
jgi:nicotinate-nucleotide adenylyltransferase